MPAAARPSRLRVVLISALAAVAALVGAALVPVIANATNLALSGTVTGPNGKALPGVYVNVVQLSPGFSTIATVKASSTGAYSFGSLPAGPDYTLRFGATSTTYVQYLGETTDSSSAQTFALVAAGSFHTTINATLAASGSISGYVKSITHAALHGYTVRAYAVGGDGSVQGSATTSTTGAYTIAGLEPGQYQLESLYTGANPPYGPEYSGGSTTLADATPVQVIASRTASYSFTMGKAGAISGTVTGETTSGSIPLVGVTVTPLLMSGTSPSFTSASSVNMPSVVTTASGGYSLTGLMPGYYTLQFTPGNTTPLSPTSDPYGGSFLNDASGEAIDATVVHVVGGTTVTNTNEELQEEASVTVTVTDSSSSATISNLLVTVDHFGAPADQPNDGSQTAVTDGSGQVTFHGLGEGRYEVIVGSTNPSDGTNQLYQREIVEFNNQLVAGETDIENLTATLKVAGGLQPTAPIAIACCGGAPWKVGEEIGVDPYLISWNDEYVNPDQDTFQWYRNGVAIPGATGNLYDLQAADAGQNIYATVTAYDLAYGSGTATSESPGTIGAGLLYTIDGNGYISGLEEVESTLKYLPSQWSVPDVHEQDVWQESTDGGSTWPAMAVQPTNNTYVPTPSDLGDEIRVEVTGSLQGYASVTYDTTPITVYAGNYTITANPKLTTTSTTWSVSSGSWSPNFGPTSYLWTVQSVNGGAPLQYTTTSISRANRTGDHVDVEVFRDPTGMNARFAPRINVQTGPAPIPTTPATLTGTPQYTGLLSANVPTYTPGGTTTTCAWQYKYGTTWKTIAGATTCTYVPGVSDVGRILRAVLTTSLYGFTTRTTILTETTAVAPLSLGNTAAPSKFGTVGTADSISVGSGTWTNFPSAFVYHWEYSKTGSAPYTAAPGGTNNPFYTIPQSLLNDTIVASVTGSRPGYASTTLLINFGVVAKDHLTPVAAPHSTVSGTSPVTITASGATFSPAASSVSYDWFAYSADGLTETEIASGTSANLTSYAHRLIKVEAVGSATGYNQTFGAVVLARKGDEVATGTLALSGGAAYSAISSSGISWNISGSAVTYQWQYKSGTLWVSIKGATASTFIPSYSYVGNTLRLLESASMANYNSATVISANTVTVDAAASPTPGSGGNAPTISGTNAVGNTLAANPGVWNVAGTSYTYQWATSPNDSTWTNIAGATSSHLVVPLSAYTGSLYVSVLITASKAGYISGSTRIATAGTATAGTIPLVTSPTVTVSGTKLTVSTGTWSHATSYSYVWDSISPIGGDTVVNTLSNTYTPGVSDTGNAIWVTVTAHGPNYLDGSKRVLARSGGAITISPAMTISGTPQTGTTLGPVIGSYSVNSPAVSWQWYRSGKAIPGATSADYTPVTADVGHALSLTVTVSESGWTTEKFSASTAVIQSTAFIYYAGKPTITGTPGVDDVLTAAQAAWTESGVTTTYQWFSGINAIPGATTNKYTVTAADLGNDVYVLETGTKPYRPTATAEAGPVTIAEGATLAPATAVKIAGGSTATTTVLGRVLSASYGAWNFPVTLTYQWQYEAPLSSTWIDISGATAITYTPSVADSEAVGGSIRLVVTAQRPGHTTVSLTSPFVTIVP